MRLVVHLRNLHGFHFIIHPLSELMHRRVVPFFVDLAEVTELVVNIQPIVTLVCLVPQIEVVMQTTDKALIPFIIIILYLLL